MPRDPAAADASPAAAHEHARLTALDSYAVLGTEAEPAFDDLTRLAAHLLQAPMALVNLVDADRSWAKSAFGLNRGDAPRAIVFCEQPVATGQLCVIPDTLDDERVAYYPQVAGEPHIRFYAGAPLIAPDGHVLGTLCVMDFVPRQPGAEQLELLGALARQAMALLEQRRQAAALAETRRVLDGVLDHTDVIVYAKDLDGRYLLANASFARIAGRSVAEIVGSTDLDLFPRDAAESYRHNDRQIAGTGQQQVFEERAQHLDGSQHVSLSTKFPLLDQEGAVYAVGGVTTEVTELTAARQALAESEQRWRSLVEHSPVAVAVYTADDLRFVFANPAALRVYGLKHESELVGRSQLDVVPPQVRPSYRRNLARILGGEPVLGLESQMLGFDGVVRDVEINAAAVTFDGRPAVQVEVRDITARVLAVAEQRASAAFHDAVLAASPDMIFVVDPRTNATVWSSRNLVELLGYTAEDLERLGENIIAAVAHPDDAVRLRAVNSAARDLSDGEVLQIRYRALHVAGDYRWLSRRVTPFARDVYGEVTQLLGVARDVTDVVEVEERLRTAALHDPLTGLPNRTLLGDRLRRALTRSARTGMPLAVLFCDLDGFKAVNDTGGHAAGDEVLRVTASRLQSAMRAEDSVARLGGDEFVVLVEPNPRGEAGALQDDALLIAQRIEAVLSHPIHFQGRDYLVTASIGITIAASDSDAEQILRDADTAMYAAKTAGKARHTLFAT